MNEYQQKIKELESYGLYIYDIRDLSIDEFKGLIDTLECGMLRDLKNLSNNQYYVIRKVKFSDLEDVVDILKEQFEDLVGFYEPSLK